MVEQKASLRDVAQMVKRALADAPALLFVFGAGMSVDSGIPDYRSAGGWYDADSPLRKRHPAFMPLLQGKELAATPRQSWELWWSQQDVFHRARPHPGYQYLSELAAGRGDAAFVLTTNVDGLAGKAGFAAERVHACHGSMFRLQCSVPCCRETWLMPEGDHPSDDADRLLPLCPFCGAVARPNVYFFGDSEERYVWEGQQAQAQKFVDWLSRWGNSMLMLEIGCGTGAPGMRYRTETFLRDHPRTRLLRINRDEIDVALRELRALRDETITVRMEDDGAACDPAVFGKNDWRLCLIRATAESIFR
jgi:NAD-dependent SIR2 family protein deacetylase